MTYIIQNGVTAVDMATVGDRRDIAELLSAAAEQQQATPTTAPQYSTMTSSSTAGMTAEFTTTETTSELPPTQLLASTRARDESAVLVETEQPLPYLPPSTSPSTPVTSHLPPSTSPPTPPFSHPPPSTSPPTLVPSPGTTSAGTQQSSNQPTSSGGLSFEVCTLSTLISSGDVNQS